MSGKTSYETWRDDFYAERERAERAEATLTKVQELCQDTDGNWLHPESELPVGNFIAALTDGETVDPNGPGDAGPAEY